MTTCHRTLVSLLLVVLACSGCAPDAPPKVAVVADAAPPPVPAPPPALSPVPMPVAPAKALDITGWWDRPEVLASLGLTLAEGAALAVELVKFEQTYQIAQRQLRTVRSTQMQMLQDPQVPSADIRRFNQRNLQMLLTSMLDQNIAARLWVREHLSADQSTRVLDRWPRFYALPWFRAAPKSQARM